MTSAFLEMPPIGRLYSLFDALFSAINRHYPSLLGHRLLMLLLHFIIHFSDLRAARPMDFNCMQTSRTCMVMMYRVLSSIDLNK